jgi:hypothetical protein
VLPPINRDGVRTITIAILVGAANIAVSHIIFFGPGLALASSRPVESTGLLFWGVTGGITGAIIGAIFLKIMKLSLLATSWTGIIVGIIPSIIYIIEIANASYNVFIIEGLAVLLNIGVFLVVFPSVGLFCSIFLYMIWKFADITMSRLIRTVGNN